MDKIVCSEMNCILNQLDINDLLKIPAELINYFKENADKQYDCKIDFTLPLENQNLNPETMNYLCAINYLYLSDKSEQEELRKIYVKNDRRIAEETDIYKVFEKKKEKNAEKYHSSTSDNPLIIYEKHSLIRNIIHKIKAFFNKT